MLHPHSKRLQSDRWQDFLWMQGINFLHVNYIYIFSLHATVSDGMLVSYFRFIVALFLSFLFSIVKVFGW